MLYAVLFEDHAGRADIRPRYMSEHRAFLERNAKAIQAAGPLQDGTTGDASGGLWLVQAENTQAVQALIEADPFWPTGLRKSVRILEWRQVFTTGESVEGLSR